MDDPGARRPRALSRPLEQVVAQLRPLHAALGRPRPGEWRWAHAEPPQRFLEYLASYPVTATARRRVLYVLPLGQLSPGQARLLEGTRAYLEAFFGLPCRCLPRAHLDAVPEQARRSSPWDGGTQLLTTWLLRDVLAPRLPRDAAACLGLASEDLWAGPGWSFVFGQASLRDRVGVWSLFRNGDPDAGPAAFRQCLRRTVQTAAHETAHMFSIPHCVLHPCLMNGSNGREEADRRPLALCPECLAKVCWAAGCEPVRRYRDLADRCRAEGLYSDAGRYDELRSALRGRDAA